MTIHTRRARQKAQLRQEIIDAARDILAREGFEQLSMRKVAERIEYSPTAIYLHFEDKRDLVFQVCEETFGRLVAELASLETDVKDPVARLREGMRRYVAFGLRHPQHYLATFVAVPHEQLPEDVARYNNPDSNGMKALGVMRTSIQACIDAGKFRKVNPDVTTRAAWAALHGVTALLIQMPNFAWGDQKAVIESLIGTTIEGLKLRKR
ncbi:MAG: TetR/AcrR family transcriptional regulator [Vicinamibacterales bacterium]